MRRDAGALRIASRAAPEDAWTVDAGDGEIVLRPAS